MQTYVVLALIGMAALYVAYVALRRFGFLGTPAGCGCGCETGCISAAKAQKNTAGPAGAAPVDAVGALRPLTPAGAVRHGSCGCGCAASDEGRGE